MRKSLDGLIIILDSTDDKTNQKILGWYEPQHTHTKPEKINKQSLKDIYENIKIFNICLKQVTEEGKEMLEQKKILEAVMADDFLNMENMINSHSQEAQWIRYRILKSKTV